MGQDSTITSVLLGRTAGDGVGSDARPQLVLVANCDDPRAVSSRHLLDDIDEVRFGRGERTVQRMIAEGRRVLELRMPDRRMSANHGRLMRGPLGWVLDDPESKNGALIDGTVTRRGLVGDGSVIELGHTFFVFRNAVVERGAASDVSDDGLRAAAPPMMTFDGALAERFATLTRVAPTEVSVVLEGETGTGKERVARAVHELSGRSGSFVVVNCGALPPSLVEAELFGHRRGAFTGAVGERVGLVRSADRGTLFLDEIGELPATSQAAFLRVLQEREVVPVGVDHPIPVDIRLCAATLRDLEALVSSGRFRRDLYARLFGLTIELPPLKQRRVDLGLLTRRLLATIDGGTQIRFAPVAMRAVLQHDWPLNIRELEKVLTTAVALATDGVIASIQLPLGLRSAAQVEAAAPAAGGAGGANGAGGADGGAVDAAGAAATGGERRADGELRDQLVGLLTLHEGNVLAVSKALNTGRTQVYRWLQRFGIRLEGFRRGANR